MNYIQLNDLQNKKTGKLLLSMDLGGVTNLEWYLQESNFAQGFSSCPLGNPEEKYTHTILEGQKVWAIWGQY